MLRRSTLSLAVAALAATGVPAPADAAIGAMQMSGTMQFGCFGCGQRSDGSMSASATGVFDVYGVVSGSLNASFSYNSDGATCPVLASGVGTYSWGSFSGPFDFTMVGAIPSFWIKLPDGTWIHHWGSRMVTDPIGNPCGGPATMSVVTAGVTEPLS